MAQQAQVTSPDLLSVLRTRAEQARIVEDAYGPVSVAQDTMLYWLARAAKQLREAADLKQVRIGAAINRDQSAVYRFEQAAAWPRDADLLVAGYAEELAFSPVEIWEEALRLWKADGAKTATVTQIDARMRRRRKPAEDEFAEAIESAPGPSRQRRAPARKRDAS